MNAWSEAFLLRELRAAGHDIASIWDWVNEPGYWPDALPILLRYLETSPDEKVVEGIARVVTGKRYPQAVPVLISRFPSIDNETVRWAMANAIAYIGFAPFSSAVLRLASEPHFGMSREPLIGVLHRIRKPEVETLLISLLDDPVLDHPAMTSLSRCGGPDGLAALEKLDPAGRSPRLRRAYPASLKRLREKIARINHTKARSPGAS